MVREQLKGHGIDDERVLRAMDKIPRHLFVPENLRARAYEDCALGIAVGQTISQPYMVGLMSQLMELQPSDRVLEIGTGSGYQAAVLAELAAEVVSIERHAELAHRAEALLRDQGYDNVTVILGDGTQGYPEGAPYDAIVVTAGGPRVPESLGRQLTLDGRLVCPVGPRKVQELLRLVRTPKGLIKQRSVRCSFVPLIGSEGWGEGAE